MFIAAAGFLVYWWIVFFQFDQGMFFSLHWPWKAPDGKGADRLILAYTLILIPSALWLESTLFHLSNDYSWTPVLVIGILILVAIGNVMLGLLAYGSYQDGVDGSGLMIAGAVMLRNRWGRPTSLWYLRQLQITTRSWSQPVQQEFQ